MTNMSVNKRKCLSVREKVEFIRKLERGEKKYLCVKKINLSSTYKSKID
jgi:hypothetical protein